MRSRIVRVVLACAVPAGIAFPYAHPRAADVRILANENPYDPDLDLNGTGFERTPPREGRQP